MEPVVGMEHPFGYRNKAQFPVGYDRDGNVVTGFYAGRTHNIIPNTDCALGVPVNRMVLETVLSYMRAQSQRLPGGHGKGAGASCLNPVWL